MGLSFLAPVLRLACGEEPARQWREIVRLIVVPIAAFALFLAVWTIVAPLHRTKSGTVPTPAVVWNAAQSIWTIHRREVAKERAFRMSDAAREQQLAAVQSRLAELAPYQAAADQLVADAELQRADGCAARLDPLTQQRSALAARIATDQHRRTTALESLASPLSGSDALSGNDAAAKQNYLEQLRQHEALVQQEQQQLQAFDANIRSVQDQTPLRLTEARSLQAKIAEEHHYLLALADQLTGANRSVKLASAAAHLQDLQRDYAQAKGPQIDAAARRVLQAERQLQSLAASRYARPWTLPMQVMRSVACVFVGFFLGTALAVPTGILCGLSATFMAAMTPFIALFKPVSPIVWLPLSLIVVGGFIPDADNSRLLAALANAPWIGWMKINPAFIATAMTVALCSLWATLVNTALGVACVDNDHLNVARVLQLGFRCRLLKIIVPSALPLIFTGLRISLGVGWMVLIAGELLSSSEGIGKFVWDQFNNGASDSFARMTAVVFVVGIIGLLLDRLMIVCQHLVSYDMKDSLG
jgi:nitrate/nitrite transport system permease protein